MKERQYLKKEIRLCGESDGNPFTRRFTIVKKSDEGSSSVCYEAYHGNSGRGMLKEFYPRGPYGLERTKEGQLICVGGDEASQRRFREAEKEYLRPYEMLLEAKQGGDNKDLSAFIPPFEIYHGCDEDGKIIGTTYIWTPQPDLETFKKICDEIHRHPRKNPEHKLVTVLSAIDSLTKCVCALHAAGMVHRDINPSNFGFTKLGNETLMQIPTLFDINSVCSVYGDMEDVVGTEGFLEPEAGRRAATNQTDIYSIGATLFFAIVVTDETKSRGYIYRSEYYDRILEMVDDSDLIRASEANSHPRLRAILTRILGKSLCRAEDRYANCEEMIEDLEDALYYALPSDIANKGRAGEKWVLKDMEKSLDVNKGKNSFLAIQYHLYEHPLYQCCADGKGMLRVIVIGFGNYGQKFLDACLQDGQIRGMSLQVTVFSDDPTDKDIYLSERPSLAKFFNVGGSIEKGMDSYGSIEFETEKLGRDKGTDNTSIMEKLMCDQSESDCGCPRYVFIALGDDSLNHAAADACKNAAEILEMKCTISFICEGDRLAGEDEPNLCPLHINRDIKKSPLYPEIERMAFNAHMVWEKDLNIDFGTVRAEFRKKYNHDSCVSNVLSLKYKLYSMGIDLDAIGFEEAAQQFEEKMGNGLNHKMRDELICIEHRRWVTEKLCLGWSRIDDLSECAGGMTKDEKKKRHVCIVRSRPDQMLAKEYGYGKNANHKKWDKLSKTELDKLDELDRMSVELHKMFEKEARAAKKQNLLYGNIMAGIRELIEGDRNASAAFSEWFACLRDIWSGDTEKVRLCRGLEAAFLNAADSMPDDRKKPLREQVRAFDALFYPILASKEYRDWKQDDAALVDSIPFVLTYTEHAYMAIPFSADDNNSLFENVAVPTVANPDRIIYLYLLEKEQDMDKLLRAIPHVMQYMSRKRFKAAVEFVLACEKKAQDFADKVDGTEIMKLGEGRIRQVKRIASDNARAIPADIEAYLRKRSAGKRFFAVEKNDTKLSEMLLVAGFYDSFASYRFDSRGMKFDEVVGCDMLRYIRKTPYMTVADMMSLRLSVGDSGHKPEFVKDDYGKLWEKYQENTNSWKFLCTALGEHAEKNDIIAGFKKWQSDKNLETYQYIIPFECSRSAEKIIQSLEEHDIIGKDSYVTGRTTDSCKVTIHGSRGYKGEFGKLFSDVYALMIADDIRVCPNPKDHEVDVKFDSLVVSDAPIDVRQRSLMNYFYEEGYVINLQFGQAENNKVRVSFTYASRQIKELLTTEGKMLEVHTYRKAKELGEFDDVESGYEVSWEGTDVKSEFDCVLTKGFRSLFVECKARPHIDQNFYYKLGQLTGQFGINATAVLVADTQEVDSAPLNDMQRERGNMLGVITVYKRDEIEDIGNTLLRIIDGNYGNKDKDKEERDHG